MENEKLTFEERLKQVEALTQQLESGKTGLEESMKLFEAGMQQLSSLEKELNQAQQLLTVIRQKSDGTISETTATEAQ